MSLQWVSNTGVMSPVRAAANETFLMGCYNGMWSHDQSAAARVQHAKVFATMMQDIPDDDRTPRQQAMLREAMTVVGSGTNQSMFGQATTVPVQTQSTALPTTNAAADLTPAPSPPQSNLVGFVAQGRDVVESHDMVTSARKSAYFTNHEEFILAELVLNCTDSRSELVEGLPGRTFKCIRKHMQMHKWKTFYTEYSAKQAKQKKARACKKTS
ncbi:hypothetical protein LTS10_007537 [Elasticomyces elasticus]|nr:hypothetical protein LTS10_007537 [Elasticomyces elasticus]